MSRESINVLTGVVAPLMLDNIDTDQIIPSREMKTVNRTGLGEGLFAGWRYTEAGSREPNPDFILNRHGYQQAEILLAGENFGCGSSREHAVWALWEFGVRAVIAKSFGDIFYNNCTRNGILPIRLEASEVEEIAAQPGPRSLTIDLPQQTVLAGNREYRFEIGGYAKRLLLEGLDPISLTKTEMGRIEAFQASDRAERPWIYR
ncbi:MAG: 3-isopropylmalate dehydratase small subunit [Hyphomonas sp.]|nr:3-isopropylmalate dehydratase small subunit [Hyphomonas sp.]